MNTILTDPRAIHGISLDAQGNQSYLVGGPTNVTKIMPYRESDGVIWFAIHIGDVVVDRVCGRAVAYIVYVPPQNQMQ